jgi:hypothetical protein
MSHPDQPPDPFDTRAGGGHVDVTLIPAMLALSPGQRLLQNDRMVRTIEELRHEFAAARASDPAPNAAGERD